jgi:hypothetical protein
MCGISIAAANRIIRSARGVPNCDASIRNAELEEIVHEAYTRLQRQTAHHDSYGVDPVSLVWPGRQGLSPARRKPPFPVLSTRRDTIASRKQEKKTS